MNSAMFHDTKLIYKYQLLVYTLVKIYQKEKLRKQLLYNCNDKTRINLTQEVKYLYSEIYKTLMKAFKDNTNKWNYIPIPCFGIEELILLKCPEYPKQSTDSIQSLSKYYRHFQRTRTNNLKIFMESEKTLSSQSNLKIEE